MVKPYGIILSGSLIGALGEEIGFVWGGRWIASKRDRPHFHISFGKHHSALLALHKSGNKQGDYVNINTT